MSDGFSDALFDTLTEVLSKERQCLLAGEYSELGDLAEEKAQLIDRFMTLPDCDGRKLARLRGMAQHNNEMLDAALSGIRDVSKKMTEFQRLRTGFETYNSAGKRHRFDASLPSDLERRA